MGVIWTNKTRTKQPQSITTASNTRNLNNGLVLLWSPIQDKNFRNAARNNQAATVTTDNTTLTLSKHGRALQHSGSSSQIVIPYGETIASGTAARITIGVITSWDEGPNPIIYAEASSGLLTVATSWPDITSVNWYGGGTTRELAIPGASEGVPWLTGYDGTNIWVGSQSVYQQWAETGAARSHNDARLYFGWDTQGTAPKTSLIAVWNRSLSRREQVEWASNPWQLFDPERRPIFFNAAGGGSTVTGVGSSDGVGTVSGVGANTSAQVGSSAGVGAASGVGASTANSVGSSTGTGTASGVGSSTGGSDGAGSATGTGTATGVGASTAASLGSTAGVGTASGIGASTAASVGSASGTGTASGVGTNGSVVTTGVGSAAGTGTATGISPTVSRGGGKTTGSNLSRKQKKKLKAVESQEWLKAEETARQLLSDRFTKQTPQEKAQALETYIESLQPVIEALKALTSQIEEVVEEAPVIELTPHQEVIQRFDRLEKKVKSVEELIIILMADL